MDDLAPALDRIARRTAFSGVVRVDRGDEVAFERAYGFAHRGEQLPNTPATRFGTASGTKGLTAVTVMSLVEDGSLELATTARSLLGEDLPLIAPDVTVEQLLAHRSGIGDYLDEQDEDLDLLDHLMPVPVHELATTEDYLRVLDGHPTSFPAGERFAYCNSGYVVLALLAERAAGVSFHQLVQDRVLTPAGMDRTGFLRSDEPPEGVALGYLEADGTRTNVFHLPVRGSGDGGIATTVGDVAAFWTAFAAGRLVSERTVAEMLRPRSVVPDGGDGYGLGFWLLAGSGIVKLIGSDPGVSFHSLHRRSDGTTATTVSNTTEGAWPLARQLEATIGGSGGSDGS
jgi:CubicO group peptidase (beta-lactamase class C family)